MTGVTELVLEYVSGFDDLSPLRNLKRLRALHVENLRGVSDFGGLSGVESLEYLAVYGTLWKQPIRDFEFLRGLPRLEVLALWEVTNKTPYPALLPALGLTHLKKLRVHGSYLPVEECALLEEGLEGVEGAAFGPFRIVASAALELPQDDVRAHLPLEVLRSNHPDVTVHHDGKRTVEDPASRWFELTGKGARKIKSDSPKAEEKCRDYARRYAALRADARALIDRERGNRVPSL